MASSTPSDRVASLLATANERRQTGDIAYAVKALREASHIEPGNSEVQGALKSIQAGDEGRHAEDLVQSYLTGNGKVTEQRALQSLHPQKLTPAQATSLVDNLLDSTEQVAPIDALLAALINGSSDARRSVAIRITNNATETYEACFDAGEDAFNAFASVPLDSAAWRKQGLQVAAQQDVFRLDIAKLMEPGVTRTDLPMKAIARQLSVAPNAAKSLLDEDAFDAILSSLDIRLAQVLRSQAMLAASKALEVTGETGESLFANFIAGKVSKGTNDDLIVAFSAASAMFPIIPAVTARLFMTDGFVQQLVPNLERDSEAAAAGKRKSHKLEQAALELLSAACVDKPCREAVQRYCTHWLKALTEEREGVHQALAALVLAKVEGGSSEDTITTKLSGLAVDSSEASDQAIEGLAYTSLQPMVKEQIAKNSKLLRSLVTSLSQRSSAAFGCLTIFTNISAYRPAQSEEQAKVAQLKAYANQTKLPPPDPLDDDVAVTTRCKKLLDADLVQAIAAISRKPTSPAITALIVQTLLSLSKEQKHRPKLVQQGAVKLLLQIYNRLATSTQPISESNTTEHSASHALARLLISVNPSLVFSTSIPVTSAVSALIPLLATDPNATERNLLPTFEALLALTNLASMSDPSPRDMLLRVAWTTIEDQLLLSSNTMIQRASVELVCNLMNSPAGVAKFADGSGKAKNRLHILLALADAEDLATRRAAGGALAMLTEWDAAAEAVLERERGVEILLGLCGDEDEGVRHRGLVCVGNVVGAPGEVGVKGVERVKKEGGGEIVRDALKGVKEAEVLGVGVEILKKLG
ncbi:hypothetical protein B0A48_04797 [Cryoendolithus antarcticus]|uniref:UNC-45/Cro1/She4 central domain-containing protein n=1 Tax=Cryoendolithus antarcticus TaxID=1507870 RepID=A0A1V8TDD3_9PEZI|nr:hypothetical protein B0A48_04797 [Cryoendolithus antarcticus]